MLETYRTDTRESTRNHIRPRHERCYATTNTVVQRARAVKRWYYGSARHGLGLAHQRLARSHHRMRELHLAGCSYREIADTLGYRAHSHVHKLITQVYQQQVAAMRAFDGAWWQTEIIDLFEDLDLPLPAAQEGCSLPKGGSGTT